MNLPVVLAGDGLSRGYFTKALYAIGVVYHHEFIYFLKMLLWEQQRLKKREPLTTTNTQPFV
jgi:hypothetical protein